eukprot:GGOE01042944.1.p1 GENE.GGOE01042944.1~~GGOE01042944.1.p1  ORF type:complete len:480 (+),score=131.42 GGOE01042944.1:205-1440(+)
MTQLLGGCLSATFGGCKVLVAAVLLWSSFTILTPVAAPHFPLVLGVRMGMGMGEGLALPAIHSLISRYISPVARSRATCFISSGHGVGMIIALLASPMLPWEMMFHIFGTLGYVWVAMYLIASPKEFRDLEDSADRDFQKNGVLEDVESAVLDTDASRMAITRSPFRHPAMESNADHTPSRMLSLQLQSPINVLPAVWASSSPIASQLTLAGAMMRNRHCLAIFAAHFASAWGWYIILSWLPKYLKSLGAETHRVGIYAIAPFLSQVLLDIFAGWLADVLLERGYNRTRLRKAFTALSLGGSGLLLLLLAHLQLRSVFAVTAIMTAAMGVKGFGHAGFFVNMIDIAPFAAGQLFGLSNTLATTAGILGNLATGWLWQTTGAFEVIFLSCAAIDLLGTAAFCMFATGNVVFK